jgi:Flp pilus assembly protein TadG
LRLFFGRRVQGRARRAAGGQSLVEFALLLPVFMLIAMIGLDFGRAFVAWVNLQQSARIAANYISINPTALELHAERLEQDAATNVRSPLQGRGHQQL